MIIVVIIYLYNKHIQYTQMNSYPNGQFTTLHGFFLVHGVRLVFGSSDLAPSYLRIAKALPGSTGC